VLIEVYGDDGKVSGAGSGFFVSSDGKILTNYHVIQHSKQATVRLSNEDAYDSVEVIDVDKRKDIALLKIKAVNQPFVKLGHSAGAQVGDKIYTLGTPLGVFQNTLSDGILSGIRQMDGYRLFQLSAPISHGSSGSPVFNTSGEVIAIVEATLPEGQNLNFSIPIDYAAGMLGSSQSHPLASVYEPEETPSANDAKPAAAAAKATAVTSAPPGPMPSESLKADPFTYLGTKVSIWTKADAEIELGPPIDRRDGIIKGVVTSDIYKYTFPYSGFGAVELNIYRSTERVGAIYFYYRTVVSWSQVEKVLGKNYKKERLARGEPGKAYLYEIAGRHVYVLLDSLDNVRSIGV
jgi:hypothetical protein